MNHVSKQVRRAINRGEQYDLSIHLYYIQNRIYANIQIVK